MTETLRERCVCGAEIEVQDGHLFSGWDTWYGAPQQVEQWREKHSHHEMSDEIKPGLLGS